MVKQADKPVQNYETQRLTDDADGIAQAVSLLRTGQTVAIPTETVYGLAADATNSLAVARIYAAKGRPSFNPLIVHVPNAAAAVTLVHLPDTAHALIDRFWPGPLTLVAPVRSGNGIASLVCAGLDTLAVRVPAHPVMQSVLRKFGKPLAAPSANASGRLSPTRAAHVLASLDGKISAVIDAGPCEKGLESTIIGFTDGQPLLLRAGAIPPEEIESIMNRKLLHADLGKISAPGQLLSHYAPTKPLRLNATQAMADEVLIGFGTMPADYNLSITADLVEAAATLFDVLHQADAHQASRIAVAPIPMQGLGVAINDRLQRAVVR
jgi:L-threonylcarbamoyladenylate synthase